MVAPVIAWLPYQRAWIEDRARFKIGMFTRRGGKTFGSSGEIVDDCIQAELAGRRVRWTILSRSDNTAKEALEDALKPITRAFWAVYNEVARLKGAPEFGEDQFYAPEIDATYKTHEVRFPHGSRVVAISASPDAARGFGGNLLLDEFAFHQDGRRIWASAFPVAARGGHKIRVISTPNGKGNKFYDLMTSAENGWSKHHVDIHEAVRQGLDVDIAALKAGMADEDAWAQEFELKWLDEASSWLSFDLIADCEREGLGDPRRYLGGPCYVGVDIAARNDLFVIWVLEQVGERLLTREVVVRRRITFAEQDGLLDEVMRRYRVVRLRMDQTGMGEKPVEDARRRHGRERVEGVIFTATAKLDMATGMKEAMQDRRLLLPLGDSAMRSDLHAVKSRVGPTGARRLVADGESDGHADRFWALALASSAAELAYQPFDYRAVPAGAAERQVRITGGFAARRGVW